MGMENAMIGNIMGKVPKRRGGEKLEINLLAPDDQVWCTGHRLGC